MVGIIRRREQVKVESSFNPDDMFDENHIATEENFIKLLEHNIYDSKYIGYKVQLSNSVDYNNGLWVIADVNHDSENTGQTNCYDLISEDCFHKAWFSSYSPYQYWRDSTPRTWLNDTFYNGFSSAFKTHMNNITYDSNGSTYTDDKIIIPSYVEVNGDPSYSYHLVEGIAYPIFTNYVSRKKYQAGTTSYVSWWTRSRNTQYGQERYVWVVGTDGSVSSKGIGLSNCYLAPILRVS